MRWLISSWPIVSVMSPGSPGVAGGGGGIALHTVSRCHRRSRAEAAGVDLELAVDERRDARVALPGDQVLVGLRAVCDGGVGRRWRVAIGAHRRDADVVSPDLGAIWGEPLGEDLVLPVHQGAASSSPSQVTRYSFARVPTTPEAGAAKAVSPSGPIVEIRWSRCRPARRGVEALDVDLVLVDDQGASVVSPSHATRYSLLTGL